MRQTSHDARAVVRAIDALTEEVRRLADAQPTPPPMDPVHILGIEAEGPSCSSVPACDGQCCKQAPAADEDAQRTARRDSAHNLLARLDRGGLLSPADCALLRQHFDAETREHDTARAVARSNLRHVQTIVPEIDRLARELDEMRGNYEGACKTIAAMHAAAVGRSDRGPDRGVVEDVADIRARMLAAEEALTNALAAIERVRAIPESWEQMPKGRHVYIHEAARTVRAALDGTEQPTTEAEGCCGKPAGAICVHDVSQPEE